MSFVNRSDKETLSNMLCASFVTSAAASPRLTGGSLRWEKAIIHRLPKSKVLLTPFIYYQQPLTLGCAFSTSGFREKGPGRESHVLEVMSSWIMHSKTKLLGRRKEFHRSSENMRSYAPYPSKIDFLAWAESNFLFFCDFSYHIYNSNKIRLYIMKGAMQPLGNNDGCKSTRCTWSGVAPQTYILTLCRVIRQCSVIPTHYLQSVLKRLDAHFKSQF